MQAMKYEAGYSSRHAQQVQNDPEKHDETDRKFRILRETEHRRVIQSMKIVMRLSRTALLLRIGNFYLLIPQFRHDAAHERRGIVQSAQDVHKALIV